MVKRWKLMHDWLCSCPSILSLGDYVDLTAYWGKEARYQPRGISSGAPVHTQPINPNPTAMPMATRSQKHVSDNTPSGDDLPATPSVSAQTGGASFGYPGARPSPPRRGDDVTMLTVIHSLELCLPRISYSDITYRVYTLAIWIIIFITDSKVGADFNALALRRNYKRDHTDNYGFE